MSTLIERPWTAHTQSVAPELLAGDLIHPDHPLFGLVWINRERLGGTPCFYGSRVPIKTLFDYLKSNHTLDEFLADFDGIAREQAAGVLELARQDLLAELPQA